MHASTSATTVSWLVERKEGQRIVGDNARKSVIVSDREDLVGDVDVCVDVE